MVSSGHYAASMAGHRMLQQGGNAIDAAVAAAFANTVVEPSRAGIGGDLFILIYLAKTKEVKFINGSGWAPRSATIEAIRARGGQKMDGPTAPLVPGATAALLLASEKYGRLRREQLLAPATELAERGFAISENLQNVLRRNQKRLADFPSTTRMWFRKGEPVAMADVVVQKDLAQTFRTIAANGRRGFYSGPIARRIVEFLKPGGGMLEEADFAEFAAEEAAPLRIQYKGYDVYGCPPNSHGHVMLQALNILEGLDLKRMGHNSADYVHSLTEALKLAFADRDAFVGDPRFVKDIPIERLLSKEYAAERRVLIRPDRAIEGLAPPGSHPSAGVQPARPTYASRLGSIRILTGEAAFPEWIEGLTTYVAAVDKERNMVSITSTIWSDFGNSMYVDGAGGGFFLNNRMGLFYLDAKDPNVLAPRKRPRMTLNPVLVMKDGRPFMAFGTPGGDTMPQSQLQFFLNFAEFGMNVQQAVEQPYVVTSSLRRSLAPHQVGGSLSVSERVAAEVRAELARRGHRVVTHDAKGVGSVKAILVDPRSGLLMGAAAPATDSYAIGW